MIKFDCEKCGRIEMALLNGYYVGDRLLEGVLFECQQNDDGTFNIQITEDSKEYFSQFNQQMWLTRMVEYAQNIDFFICPTCGNDVVPEDEL